MIFLTATKSTIMFKLFLTTTVLIGAATFPSFAQSIFSVDFNPASATTTGTEDHDPNPTTYSDWDVLKIDNNLENLTADTIIYNWQILTPYDLPEGWTMHGFCDNKSCRTPWASGAPGTPAPWTTGAVEESMKLANDTRSPFYLQVAAPSSAANGTLTVKVRVWSGSQVDTVLFIATKDNSTGLSGISVMDERVVLQPNPANDYMYVYADKSINAKSISVVDMLGRQVTAKTIEAGKESSYVNLRNFTSGLYMVRVMDSKGNILTTRKLIKN